MIRVACVRVVVLLRTQPVIVDKQAKIRDATPRGALRHPTPDNAGVARRPRPERTVVRRLLVPDSIGAPPRLTRVPAGALLPATPARGSGPRPQTPPAASAPPPPIRDRGGVCRHLTPRHTAGRTRIRRPAVADRTRPRRGAVVGKTRVRPAAVAGRILALPVP